ncbi:hypothetical protein As57867_022706, partial [Aphanomyces stellatus]
MYIFSDLPFLKLEDGKHKGFWFALVDSKGEAYNGTTASSVDIPSSRTIDQLRDAVKEKCDQQGYDLKGIFSSKLHVYANKAAFDGKAEPLGVGETIEDHGILWTDPFLVVVRGPATSRQSVVEFSLGFVDCEIGFYNDIVNADVKDGWLYFIQTIPSSAAKPEALLVRASYQTIASSIQDRGKDGIFKTIITGTTGIGKSLFLIYLLWNLVKAGKKVLFIYHPNLIYYDGLGGVFEFLRDLPSVANHSFWDESLWCLFDAKGKNERHLSAIPYDNCKVVVSTSPRRDMINDFKKPPTPKIFYMPLWTEHELEQVASTFPQVVDWRDRFNILGGVPRTVLENTEQEATSILEAACTYCELNDCIKVVGLDSAITDNVHSLVHITSESPFITSSVCYASTFALDIIVRAKGVEARRTMQVLLPSCAGNPLVASLCGYIFEPYAMDLLAAGGTFQYHELTHGNKKAKPDENVLTIQASNKIVAGE